MTKILFVCLGNICRSPLADGVFRYLAKEAGQLDLFEIDSAGTSGWHVNEKPDSRMRQTAHSHGVSLDDIRGRGFIAKDLESFDLILAMDRSNFDAIVATDNQGIYRDKIKLFRDFDPARGDGEVPDPYYGGPAGFENVYNIVERTCRNLIKVLMLRTSASKGNQLPSS